jgi:Fur family peroxide stress response transcriptional regulator
MSKVKLDRQEKIASLEAKCRKRGIPMTVQRRAIFEALLDRQDHPTIDQVYEDVKDRIPGVSRTTVYRTLETFVDLGVSRKTSHVAAMARFDGNVGHHHHLVCLRCDKVVDIDDPALSRLPLPDARRTGFEIVDFSVYLEGLCPDCKKTAPKASASKRLGKKHI